MQFEGEKEDSAIEVTSGMFKADMYILQFCLNVVTLPENYKRSYFAI